MVYERPAFCGDAGRGAESAYYLRCLFPFNEIRLNLVR